MLIRIVWVIFLSLKKSYWYLWLCLLSHSGSGSLTWRQILKNVDSTWPFIFLHGWHGNSGKQSSFQTLKEWRPWDLVSRTLAKKYKWKKKKEYSWINLQKNREKFSFSGLCMKHFWVIQTAYRIVLSMLLIYYKTF